MMLYNSGSRAEESLTIPYFSSLGGVYCSEGQALDCSVRQSSCFSELSVGQKPTEG